ncbi:MAG TPA: pitrilysin family protein [Anaerolineaceae bacterium]|nr:pitrilysin family protein [Anaerolineaceae bacterium]
MMQSNNTNFQNHFPNASTIRRFQLGNGITVLAYSNMHSKSLTVIGMLATGSAWDQAGKLGTAHFTASMLMRGNEKMTFREISDRLESVGASLSFSAGTLNTWFQGRSLVKDFPMLLALLYDNLTSPIFPQEYITRLRNQLITSLLIRDQDTQERAALEFDKVLFKSHPYALPVDGYAETIANIQRHDLTKHHSMYHPHNAVIAVSGALPLQDIESMIKGQFDQWAPKKESVNPVSTGFEAIIEETRSHIPIEGKSQSDIQMGTFGPSRASADYYAAYLGNHVLGQFGLYGRIGRSVRNKAGLAYYAFSSLNALPEIGSWEFNAGVNPVNVEKTITLIKDEIRHYLEEPLQEDELEDSKSHLIGRLPMSLESNAGIANALLSIERFHLGLDYFQNYASLISSITPAQILEASRRYLDPEKLIIISAGAEK